MKEISYQEILKSAEVAVDEGIVWHHHYLPPNCALNTKDKHMIVLEVEGEEAVAVFFEGKPMQELEKLENLFFSRS